MSCSPSPCVALLAPGTALAKKKHKRHGPKKENSPLVIGHRGASGFVPEHTLQSYRLAIKLGADYIEPDLVATKDGVLIARHEPIIGDSDPATTGDSTNVGEHPEFASRETTRTLDGVPTKGFWAQDFTLAEIKTLGARQTRGGRPTEFNGQFKVPTLQEIINLVKRESRKHGRKIGIYPETKHPTFHKTIGLPLEGRLVKVLKKNGLNSRSSPRLHPVLRAGQPEGAEHDDAGQADPADGRQRHGRQRQPDLRRAVRPPLRLDGLGRSDADEPDVRLLRHGRGPR